MLSKISSFARSSVIALAALAALPAAASAAPLGPLAVPAVAGGTLAPTLVQGEGRDHGPGYQFWPRNVGGRNWNGGGGRHWRGGRNWDRGYRHGGYDRGHYGRGHYNHHNGYDGYNSGLYLGLGLLPSYNDYDPYYNNSYYNEPIYRPRVYRQRVYRHAGSSHVEWCYNRYRSYRERDNTFQPYHGPRQQCYSPYS